MNYFKNKTFIFQLVVQPISNKMQLKKNKFLKCYSSQNKP